MPAPPLDAHSPVLVVTGMAREVRIASGPGVAVLASGGDTGRLRELLARHRGPPCRAVLSFGIAGGLDPALRPGDVVVGTGVLCGKESWAADSAAAHRLYARLSAGGMRVTRGGLAGTDIPLLTSDDKRRLLQASGAAAADMESHAAAAYAADEGLPFAAIRVVCDPAGRSLPPLVRTALRPDGGIAFAAIARSLLDNPAQLANLPRLARDAGTAFRSLRRCGDLLGVRRGLADLGELLGDIA